MAAVPRLAPTPTEPGPCRNWLPLVVLICGWPGSVLPVRQTEPVIVAGDPKTDIRIVSRLPGV
jgi:hypothetical protein